jgi:hypothetical protein
VRSSVVSDTSPLGRQLALPAERDEAGQARNCIYRMTRRAALLARVQGRANLRCIKSAARGDLDSLGIPPQEQTAQACLTNDPTGRVGRQIDRLFGEDEGCLASAPRLMQGPSSWRQWRRRRAARSVEPYLDRM